MAQRISCPRGVAWILPASLLFTASAFADYTAIGRFQYEDRDFNMDGFTGIITRRPIRHADVRIMANGGILATGATGEDGTFSIPVASSKAEQVTAVCVAASTKTPGLLLDVRVANNNYSFGDYYSVASAPVGTSGSGIVNFDETIAAASLDAGKFFNIWDVAIDAMQFVASSGAQGSLPARMLTIIWRSDHPDDGSFYAGAGSGPYLFVGASTAYDDTVISHELGHFIDDTFSHSDSPGGQHFIGDNAQDMRLAWGEGLATYLGCSARKFHGYGRPEIYVNTDGTKLSFSYEIEYLSGAATIASRTGSTNEIAISAALWDITDGRNTEDSTPGIDDDLLEGRPFAEVWRDLTVYFPSVTKPGITVETFWNGWFSSAVNNGLLREMQDAFATVNGIEFLPDGQEPDDSVSAAPTAATPLVPGLKSGGPSVVINELDVGITDAIELYNAGDAEADITDWRAEASAPGYVTATFTIPSFKLPPGGFVILSEASAVDTNSVLYFGSNISWSNGNPGACILRDNRGVAMDFVRWGGSNERIPANLGFAGPDPPSPSSGKTLGRDFFSTDADLGNDWSAQISTFGTYNISGAEKHHTYYPTGDLDFVAFNAVAGRSYLVETLNLLNGADTVVDVVSTDGLTVLASNDDYGKWKSSRLQWLAPASGRYFVRSRRFAGPSNYAQYGSCDLRVMESTTGFGLPLASTLTVGQGGNFQTISDALAAASNGDTVQILDDGTYGENLVISNKSVTLLASGGKNPVLDGRKSQGAPALSISNAKSIRIQGITILGGARGIQINGGNVTVLNSVINGASDPGGSSDGIQVSGDASEAAIVNCTIVNSGRFGLEVRFSGSAKMANSILQNNAAGDIDSDASLKSLIISNSLLGTPVFVGKNGNVNGNAQFVASGSGNFRLRAGSPAIDAGNPADPDLPASDADGVPRSLDGTGSGKAIPDMGAYEYLAPGFLGSLAVFPQVAVGGSPAYQTSVFVVNTIGVPAAVDISLTKSNGDSFPTRVLNRPENAWLSIPPFGTADRKTAGNADLLSGYATLLSNIPVEGGALIQTLAGDRVVSEAGVGPEKPTSGFTAYIDNMNGAYSGYAIANFGPSAANLTLTLRDRAGKLTDAKSFSLGPGQQKSEFAVERFAAAQAGFEGTIEFASDQKVAAVALRYDNLAQDVFSTIPVLFDNAAIASATPPTYYFPQVADGGGYRTGIILVNPSSAATTARLEFFADDGSPLALPLGGASLKSYDVNLSGKGVASIMTDGTSAQTSVGWARVTSPGALGGSAIFQTVSGGRILSEAGVSFSPPAAHFTTYVESLGHAASGLAICNPNSGAVSVTLNLRDSAGRIAATESFALKPLEHIARFFSGPGQWFPIGFDQFQGTLEVIATGQVSAVALRYDNADASVFATLPVVPLP